ncbi:nucleoside permease [Ignatzschineria larvae DSM 13226]|uniref:Nucleoside permease n=1 Tax=Ignatzschineria larvae DSM 13226 TaxID=1111732 RepID=A0ABZ3BZA6_9GAMM|nr:nucleoside permease [Ignatzschineria larvae]
MSLSLKLKILQFLQFFIWGSWLITAGSYMGATLGFNGVQIGSIYAAMGIASIFAPSIMGIISDKWIPANYLFILCHLVGGVTLFAAAQTDSYLLFYIIMLINLFVYMPTIALSYSICYACFEQEKLDPITAFPPIRIWGTIGFIAAMWVISLSNLSVSVGQFYIASAAAFFLAVVVFFIIPKIAITKSENQNPSLVERLGLNAFVLFKNYRLATFFIFTMLLGAVLQISNTWADPFLKSFAELELYQNSFMVTQSILIVSLSQISEVFFILSVPFFLKRFGIKYIMLISMMAWFFRFLFLGLGDPSMVGTMFIILSMIVYGCAFDFFNISGSIYIEKATSPHIRNSAQGLFMTLTNGVGGFIGSYAAGFVVDKYSVYAQVMNDHGELVDKLVSRDWTTIWFVFAAYALLLAIVFFFMFKNKKDELSMLQKVGE